VGEAAEIAETSMDVSGEADYENIEQSGNIPGWKYAVVEAKTILDAEGDPRRQRELMTAADVTIGRDLHLSRQRMGPHVNRAPRGTQFDP
jgi:hypothetical protein